MLPTPPAIEDPAVMATGRGGACQPVPPWIKLIRLTRPGCSALAPILRSAARSPARCRVDKPAGSVRFGEQQSKVNSMSKQEADKDKDKEKPKKPKPPAPARPRSQEGQAAKPEAAARGGRGRPRDKEKPKAEPRPPADPRLKFIKKFHGKFLPRGPLRDRLKVLMERWDSGEDHGGVTVEELKSLYKDWKASREKPARVAKTSV